MIVVIIEFTLKPGAEKAFKAAQDELYPRVEGFDGYLGEEACRSMHDEGKFVSLSLWRDLESIRAWRMDPEHRRIQRRREEFFSGYQVRVCGVEREYAWEARAD